MLASQPSILKNKNKVTEAVTGPASLKATRNKNSRKAYIRYVETSNNLDWKPHSETNPSQQHDDHDQSKTSVDDVERKCLTLLDVEFTAKSGWFEQFKNLYSLHHGPQHRKVSINRQECSQRIILLQAKMLWKYKQTIKSPSTYFWKEWNLLYKSLRYVLPDVFQKKTLLSQEMTAPCKLFPLKTLQWDKMWKLKIVIFMILTLCRPRLMCVFVFKFLTKKNLKYKIADSPRTTFSPTNYIHGKCPVQVYRFFFIFHTVFLLTFSMFRYV